MNPPHPSSSTNFDPQASQPDRPSSFLPQQTPPSTEHLFSSSAFNLSSSQIDINPHGRRLRGRNELGDGNRYLEGVDELLSENEISGNQAAASEPVKVIWGTNIVITEAISSFKSFLANFSIAQRHLYNNQNDANSNNNVPLLDEDMMAADLEPYYPKLLQKVKYRN